MLIGHELAYMFNHLGMLGREVLAFRGIRFQIVELDLERVVVLSPTEHFLADAFPFPKPDRLLAPVTGKLAIEERSSGLLLSEQGGRYAYPVATGGEEILGFDQVEEGDHPVLETRDQIRF